MNTGRMLRTALAVLRTRASLRCLGLSALIAFAGGCSQPVSERLKECRYVSRPLTSTTGATFRYIEADAYLDSPSTCRTVTDVDGWERTFCHKGPDAAICRKVRDAKKTG